MNILSLCTGYGGLDLAVEEYFNAKTTLCAEIDKYASKVIEQNFNAENIGDLKNISDMNLQDIDIITAGYPCQPFSHAGQRKGLDDERHIWPYIIKIIGKIQPKIIVLENVRGHLKLGFNTVIGDLSQNGYDATWALVRASDVGAPHKRERIFVIAYSYCDAHSKSRRADRCVYDSSGSIINGSDRNVNRCGFKIVSNASREHESSVGQVQKLGRRFASRSEMSMQAAPNPLVEDKINAEFVEYMMGLPKGWVTNVDISRAQQLKILGNGVVPQQAYYALELLCGIQNAV